jgi:putative oxidoreductase
MNIALWIIQALLAAAFVMAGGMKAFMPVAELTKAGMTMAPALARFIGAAELAGAVGLILPAATRIAPKLTPLAAVGLLTVMVLATGFHVTRGEWHSVPVTVGLGTLAAFVAWGRFKKAPISPRA